MASPWYPTAIILLPDGSTGTLNLYAAGAQAINTYLPVSKSQRAISTDLTQFTPRVSCRLVDFVVEDAALVAGQLQLEEDGDRKGVFVSIPQSQATNAGRPRLSINLLAGRIYRFVVTVGFTA